MEILVFGLFAGLGFASYALWSRGRTSDAKPESEHTRELAAAERTLENLQVGDIVQHLGTDWLVEGALTLAEDGHERHLYRLMDGAQERFLYAMPEVPDPLLLDAAGPVTLGGQPPESLEHDGRSYRLKARVTAAALRVGTMGEGRTGDRVRLLEYGTALERLIVLDWGEHTDGYVGERVSAHLIEILPGR